MKSSPRKSQGNREFFIAVDGKLIPVNEDVYFAYKRPVWRERKRRQVCTDREQSLDALLELGLDPIDPNPLVEDIVEDRMMLDVLYNALSRLSDEERVLVRALFYDGKAERTLADEIGVPHTTIHYQKNRLLKKLRKIF